MAPTGAKPTNPKYTLTLTKGEIDAICSALFERWSKDIQMENDRMSEDAFNVLMKLVTIDT